MILFYQPYILDPLHLLDPEESRHCIKVLRKQAGDIIHITDGKGKFCKGRILDENPKKCAVEIILTEELELRQKFNVHLAVAPTKNISRFEWFLEKATEIGIDEITPILCENSERRIIKTQRLEKVMISAMKQSLKSFLPILNEPISFNDFIKNTSCNSKFIAYCSDKYRDSLMLTYQSGNDVLIMVGPEGDFSPTEISTALKNNYHPISLGESRLRTETAAIVACHTIQILNEASK